MPTRLASHKYSPSCDSDCIQHRIAKRSDVARERLGFQDGFLRVNLGEILKGFGDKQDFGFLEWRAEESDALGKTGWGGFRRIAEAGCDSDSGITRLIVIRWAGLRRSGRCAIGSACAATATTTSATTTTCCCIARSTRCARSARSAATTAAAITTGCG